MLGIEQVEAEGGPRYAVKVMNPPGNYNAAFMVTTLLVDAASGEILGEADGSAPRPAPASGESRERPRGAPPDLRDDARCAQPAPAACAVPLLAAAPAGAAGTLDEHGGPVKGVAVSADGSRALTASFDYSLILWDLPAEAVLAHLYGHDAAVNAVAFLPGDARAISASDDGTVGLWDVAGPRLLTRLEGHRGKVVAVAVAPDGELAASAGWDRTVRVWDLAARRQRHGARRQRQPQRGALLGRRRSA